MPIHASYLRSTPYESLFPDREARDAVLARIGAEIEQRGEGADDPGAFALLTRTRQALGELRDPTGEDDGGHTHAVLLFHAYHLRAAGALHYLPSVPVCRWAAGGSERPEAAAAGERSDGAAGREPGLPDAVYVQLPQHLFWVREDPVERPRSLDGFFWTVREGFLHLLGVVDFHPEGTALRVLPVPGAPLRDREVWLTERMREEGEDFASEIPGSELEGLHELRTTGELLKLAAWIDRFVAVHPERASLRDPQGAEAPPVAPLPSGLPYTRLGAD